MKAFYSILPLFFTVSLAVDYNTVRTDIANITTLLATLDADTKAVTAGSAGVAQALQLEVDAVNLHNLLLASRQHADAAPKFGAGGSLNVGLDFLNLQPKVTTTLQDVANKSSVLADLGIVVLSSLYQLKQDTDAFGKAVVAKLDALEAGIAPGVVKKIDDSFNQAIVAYGGKAS